MNAFITVSTYEIVDLFRFDNFFSANELRKIFRSYTDASYRRIILSFYFGGARARQAWQAKEILAGVNIDSADWHKAAAAEWPSTKTIENQFTKIFELLNARKDSGEATPVRRELWEKFKPGQTPSARHIERLKHCLEHNSSKKVVSASRSLECTPTSSEACSSMANTPFEEMLRVFAKHNAEQFTLVNQKFIGKSEHKFQSTI